MHPKRKANRLPDYDYSSAGGYHITICTKDSSNVFGQVVGASIARPAEMQLSFVGKVVDTAIRQIPERYPQVTVDCYVVMPNHVHLLLTIHEDGGRALLAPTISRVVQHLKGFVTKQIGCSIWQKSFNDVVIRDEQHYLRVWNYIDGNPGKWSEDEYYNGL